MTSPRTTKASYPAPCYSIFSFMCNVLKIVVCPFVIFLLTIVLSVLPRYTDSDYPFGIFKLFSGILLFLSLTRAYIFARFCRSDNRWPRHTQQKPVTPLVYKTIKTQWDYDKTWRKYMLSLETGTTRCQRRVWRYQRGNQIKIFMYYR
jgi:hypothetical protein